MAPPGDPAEQIRQWMLGVMAARGMTAPQWAKRAGIAASTIQRAIKPSYKFVTSTKTLARMASAVGELPPNVRSSTPAILSPHFLPVLHTVQAGLWFEADADAQLLSEAPKPVMPDPRYANCKQWLEHVVGDSANLKIPDGSYVHVVDAIDLGYAPKHDDWVVVERRRGGGLLRERTVKQVAVLEDGRIELWPRSTNPKWAAPVALTQGARPNEDLEIEVVGWVLGFYVTL